MVLPHPRLLSTNLGSSTGFLPIPVATKPPLVPLILTLRGHPALTSTLYTSYISFYFLIIPRQAVIQAFLVSLHSFYQYTTGTRAENEILKETNTRAGYVILHARRTNYERRIIKWHLNFQIWDSVCTFADCFQIYRSVGI